MDNEPYVLIKLPLQIAILSFAIGTFIFLAHFLIRLADPYHDAMMFAGLYFVIVAVGINIIVFFATIIASFWYRDYQKQLIINACKQLINIPIAFFYFYTVMHFTN